MIRYDIQTLFQFITESTCFAGMLTQTTAWDLGYAYFSLLTHTKQLLLVTFCEMPAGIEVSFRTDGQTDGQRQKDRQTWKLK